MLIAEQTKADLTNAFSIIPKLPATHGKPITETRSNRETGAAANFCDGLTRHVFMRD
jgi:hypothetical protein